MELRRGKDNRRDERRGEGVTGREREGAYTEEEEEEERRR